MAASVSKRGRRRPMSEINVTPFVDVMLVLLIVFMVTAPLLITGVPINLPKVQASQLTASDEQTLSVTVGPNGQLFIGAETQPVPEQQLAARLNSLAQASSERRIFVRGDSNAVYGDVLRALSIVQTAGFSNVALITDAQRQRQDEPR